MGKKSKRNKRRRNAKRRQAHYYKGQFIDIYCPKCEICITQPANPIFCYDELYVEDSHAFFRDCFSELVELKRDLEKTNTLSKDISLEQFRKVFCLHFCKKEIEVYFCNFITDCYNLFRNQIHGRIRTKAQTYKNKKKRKKQREKYICEPYPTMFTNDNEEWQAKIEEILSNGNNNRKQDKIEKSAEHSEG